MNRRTVLKTLLALPLAGQGAVKMLQGSVAASVMPDSGTVMSLGLPPQERIDMVSCGHFGTGTTAPQSKLDLLPNLQHAWQKATQ